MRLTTGTVGFLKPFQLQGVPGVFPPGTYATATIEQEGCGALFETRPESTNLFCTSVVNHSPGPEKWANVKASDLNAALDGDSYGVREAPQLGIGSGLVPGPMKSYRTLPPILNTSTGLRMPMSRRRWASRSLPR